MSGDCCRGELVDRVYAMYKAYRASEDALEKWDGEGSLLDVGFLAIDTWHNFFFAMVEMSCEERQKMDDYCRRDGLVPFFAEIWSKEVKK